MMQRLDERMVKIRNAYWHRVRKVTAALIAIWFLITFSVIFFARELSGFTFFGWPFSFYMAAQGLPLLYVAIVALYARRMHKLDKTLKSDIADGQ